ncbi:Rrf2 family protein [Bacillus sp. SORGH_AS 510]|uniref:RrF2 family transcriptional regulator n=1 Tax=Bacillus sp. SORGH_AS_0510 TaxID=3041771 RepID=UPI00277EAF57|nr:Rrf2 family transcriptional regulator [Bacillus sp. SORGH_AS_0510]MDQ1145997.1 Rrf2 family protein [Bacillus sp. SORGH_AS_0510]
MNSDFVIALHSLVLLANLPNQMANSEVIAENVCTNPARIRKIMSTLRKSGYVKTKEGIGGGYVLECDPEITTLSQIYQAMSVGSLKPNWCTGDPEKACVISSNTQVVMDNIFTEAEMHLQSYLKQVTISNVLERIKGCKLKE